MPFFVVYHFLALTNPPAEEIKSNYQFGFSFGQMKEKSIFLFKFQRKIICKANYTSLDSSLELYTGSDFLLLLFVLFVSFFAGACFLPLPLVPRRPTPLVSSSAANANKSEYCFCTGKRDE